jgi:hypothetical protein
MLRITELRKAFMLKNALYYKKKNTDDISKVKGSQGKVHEKSDTQIYLSSLSIVVLTKLSFPNVMYDQTFNVLPTWEYHQAFVQYSY